MNLYGSYLRWGVNSRRLIAKALAGGTHFAFHPSQSLPEVGNTGNAQKGARAIVEMISRRLLQCKLARRAFILRHVQSETAALKQGSDPQLEIAFTPLAMPSLAGPGSLSVVVTAASQIKSNNPDQYVRVYAGVIVGMAFTVALALAVLRSAGPIARALGPSGIDAMTRIFGFLLVAI